MATIINKERGGKLENFGTGVLRYGLVIVLLWVGLLKFSAYEAEGIKPLVENSPILSWVYDVMSVQVFAKVLAVIEIILAILIATRQFSPKLSAIGSIGVIFMALVTLSFLLTTPGVWQPEYGFPYLSPMPGQFIAKDLLLLGTAIYTAGEALEASQNTGHNYTKLNTE